MKTLVLPIEVDRLPALTVHSPWAWALVNGWKDIENRHDKFARYEGLVVVHASQQGGKKLREAASHVRQIIDTAEPCRHYIPSDREFSDLRGQLLGVVRLGGRHGPSKPPSSPWYHPGAVGIEVLESYRFTVPIRDVTGRLGLWSLDPEQLLQVEHAELKKTAERSSDVFKREGEFAPPPAGKVIDLFEALSQSLGKR